MEYIFGTYMERPYSHSSYYIFDTIGIQICDGAGDDCKSHRQTVVEDVPESEFETKNAEFTENEDLYIYETNQLSLHFSKNYWEMSIYQNGKLLTKEQAFDTNVDNRWKQLPTGFRVDASGKV